MTQSENSIGERLAVALNRDCHCISVDRKALVATLSSHLRSGGLPAGLLDTHNQLFADSPVFLWQGHIRIMEKVIRAVEHVAGTPGYRDAVLRKAPVVAQKERKSRGVFFAYDFHLGANGPRLIEINTNAGGALLNHYLAAAQQACCPEVISVLGGQPDFAAVETELVDMFRAEWHLERSTEPLGTVAIVDARPAEQFLYPEFLLFQSLFERHGISAVIADPHDFTIAGGALWVGDRKIDLVYNRLTDFYFESPESACLAEACRDGLAVFTPSPHVYALYADKRNMVLLSDSLRLGELGVDEETAATLSRHVPATVIVTKDNAAELWAGRKKLFFKPVSGFGSRGAYRGAKLTKRVWQEIVGGGYVAQALVSPSERQLVIDGEERSLKLDIRCITYRGRIQQLSARLYQGQTTNLRTRGGGLATVFPTPMGDCC